MHSGVTYSMAKKHIDEYPKAPGNGSEHTPLIDQIERGAETIVKEVQEEISGARRPWYHTIHWGRVLLTVYAILLAFFVLIAWWVSIHPVIPVDVKITREFQENQTPWLRITMLAASYIGSTFWLSTALIILAAAIFWIAHLRLEALTVLFVCATSAILNYVVKIIVERPRPNARLVEILQQASGASFPSGHVMSYVAFWGLLISFAIILFKGHRWWRLALLIIPALFIILVGPSRVYLGDHWASDVLGGYIFGGVWLGICLWVYLKLKEKGILEHRRRKFLSGWPN
jgi:membrane-associated phospholipid phosphatase